METNLIEIALIAGFLAMAIEITVLGFATLVLFFVGVGLLVFSGLAFAGLVPETSISMLLTTSIATTLVTAILWKPFKRLQNKTEAYEANTTFAHEFLLESDCDSFKGPKTTYDGVEWNVRSDESLQAGTKVKVVKEAVGTLWVSKA